MWITVWGDICIKESVNLSPKPCETNLTSSGQIRVLEIRLFLGDPMLMNYKDISFDARVPQFPENTLATNTKQLILSSFYHFVANLPKKLLHFAQTLSSIDQNFHIQNKQRMDVSCFFKMRKCCPVRKTLKHMYFTLINYIYYFNDSVPVCIYYHIDVSFYWQKKK